MPLSLQVARGTARIIEGDWQFSHKLVEGMMANMKKEELTKTRSKPAVKVMVSLEILMPTRDGSPRLLVIWPGLDYLVSLIA